MQVAGKLYLPGVEILEKPFVDLQRRCNRKFEIDGVEPIFLDSESVAGLLKLQRRRATLIIFDFHTRGIAERIELLMERLFKATWKQRFERNA